MSHRVYLDHASTTPMRPGAAEAMAETIDALAAGRLGDPSRIHAEGIAARDLLESARASVAALLGVRPREVVFTSGATESIAMACFGAAHRDDAPGRHQVLSAAEHSAVRGWSERLGATVVGIDTGARIDVDALLDAIRPETALVHAQWANHEVGVTQPVHEVVAACRERGVWCHVDAAQAVGRLPVDLGALGADLVSVSGHKLGGPPGSGVLVVRRGLRAAPLSLGGDQERARRGGLENLPAAVGLAAAAEEVAAELHGESARLRSLTQRVIDWAATRSDVQVLGDPAHRAPHLVCLALDGVEPQPVLLGLDAAGIAVHSGSSCSSEAFEPSPVLAAMGVDAQRSLRISVGWTTTASGIDRLLAELPRTLDRLHALRPG